MVQEEKQNFLINNINALVTFNYKWLIVHIVILRLKRFKLLHLSQEWIQKHWTLFFFLFVIVFK